MARQRRQNLGFQEMNTLPEILSTQGEYTKHCRGRTLISLTAPLRQKPPRNQEVACDQRSLGDLCDVILESARASPGCNLNVRSKYYKTSDDGRIR